MADKFANQADLVFAASRAPFDIVPHDTNEISPLPKALRIKTAGNVVFRGVDGSADLTWAVTAGENIMVRAQYVRATGTTATLSAY